MRRLRRHPDEGFSMIEVIVAIVILGIVASSALWFFINGMQTSSNLDRQQTAVSIATSTMEQTFTYDPRKSTTTGISGLVTGRSAAEVNTAFSDLSGMSIPGLADTYPLSDPAGVTGGGDPKVVTTVTRGKDVNYTVYTLVGACYRTASVGGTTQPCQKVNFYPTTEPTSIPVGTVRMLRVIVAVTWNPIGNECTGAAGKCEYDVATLVDPSLDLQWNRVIKPVAVDDTFSFSPGDAGYNLDVLDNDILGSVRSWPVQLVAPYLNASAGSLTVNSTGTIAYSPPVGDKAHWVSGIFPFTYQVFDRTGASDTATVSVYLQPQSANDPNLTATLGVAQVLDVTANDLGSPALITITSPPASGSISVSGATLTYTPATKGTFSFTYKYSDSSGLTSPDATATVKVDSVTAYDITVNVPYITDASAAGSWKDISANLIGSAPSGTKIVIGQAPAAASGTSGTGLLRVDGVAYVSGTIVTGAKVEFQPPASKGGEWTFPYALTLGGFASDPAIADMKVTAPVPLSVADDGTTKSPYTYVVAKKAELAVPAGKNDSPTTWPSGGGVTVNLVSIDNGCGAWVTPTTADLAAGQLRITAPSSAKNPCHATYTLTRGGVTTSTATITYSVTN